MSPNPHRYQSDLFIDHRREADAVRRNVEQAQAGQSVAEPIVNFWGVRGSGTAFCWTILQSVARRLFPAWCGSVWMMGSVAAMKSGTGYSVGRATHYAMDDGQGRDAEYLPQFMINADDIQSERLKSETLWREYNERRHELEKQQATFGINADPAVAIEVRRITARMEELRKRYAVLSEMLQQL